MKGLYKDFIKFINKMIKFDKYLIFLIYFQLFKNICLICSFIIIFLPKTRVTNQNQTQRRKCMFWTPELAQYLEDAPFPATKEELLDYANRSACPQQVIDNLYELDDTDELVESIEDLWPEYDDVTNGEYFYNDDEEEQYV